MRTSCGVARIDRPASGHGPVTITTEKGDQEQFDAVVLATHSDTSLKMLGEGATELVRGGLEVLCAGAGGDGAGKRGGGLRQLR